LAEDCTKKLTAARASRRDQPSRNFDRNLAPKGRNFKNNGQSQRRFPEGKDRVQNGLECAKCGRYQGIGYAFSVQTFVTVEVTVELLLKSMVR
ncbi:hypothetical protein PIB30_086011, partial [Stylosanthes scabra]|nr:hypothetical protein [Stylosanthes scabra]